MARGNMNYSYGAVGGDVEILYNSDFTAKAVTLDTTAFTGGVCKAGTPVSANGTIANDATVLGILLHDVLETRPQGTAVYYGTIHAGRAQAHSGVEYAAAMMSALKNLVFFEAE